MFSSDVPHPHPWPSLSFVSPGRVGPGAPKGANSADREKECPSLPSLEASSPAWAGCKAAAESKVCAGGLAI